MQMLVHLFQFFPQRKRNETNQKRSLQIRPARKCSFRVSDENGDLILNIITESSWAWVPWSTSYSFNYSNHVPPGVHSHSPFRLPRPLVTDTHSCTLLRCCCFLYNPTQSSHERESLPDNETYLKPHLYPSSPVSLKKKQPYFFLCYSYHHHHP